MKVTDIAATLGPFVAFGASSGMLIYFLHLCNTAMEKEVAISLLLDRKYLIVEIYANNERINSTILFAGLIN
jgi:hypothetical protein